MRTCAVEHLPCPFLPSVYLIWIKVYLDIDLLSICLIFFFFFCFFDIEIYELFVYFGD